MRQKTYLLCVTGLLAIYTGSASADYLVNENFNSFDNNSTFPTSSSIWVQQGNTGSSMTITTSSSAESPITAATNGKGVLIYDNSSSLGTGVGVNVNFEDQQRTLLVSFDYKIINSGANNDAPTLTTRYNQTETSKKVGSYLSLCHYDANTDQYYLGNQVNSGIIDLTPILLDTWYHVDMTVYFNSTTQRYSTYSVVLYSVDGTRLYESGILTSRDSLVAIDEIAFNQNTGGVGTGSFAIDNVQVQTIPEAASLGLLGLGTIALLRRR